MLGLIPDCPPERVKAAGNAAGSGAVRALLSAAARAEIAEVARTVTKVETAIEPRFQEHFVASLAFPHATDPYPCLSQVVSCRTARRRRRGHEPPTARPHPTTPTAREDSMSEQSERMARAAESGER